MIAPPQITEPWARAGPEILAELAVTAQGGLSDAEVRRRVQAYGKNVLREVKRRPAWAIVVAQFKSLLVALLAAAAAAAAAFAEWVEAGAILVVLLINALLGFVTELKAVRSMEALRKMGAVRTTVRRSGEVAPVPAAELVPGDIVIVEGGDVVTADLRLVEASKLQANESTLTGESVPVGKSTATVPSAAALGDREGMLFKGTVVTRGSGVAVVVATGMSSELGRISQLVQEAGDETTPLEQRLNRLGRGLVWVTLIIAALVAASGLLSGKPVLLVIETAIALAVAAIPEGLPIIATIALARGMQHMAGHNALVKRLSAVETLGATSVICTDKTGTLTENRIRVARLALMDEARDRQRALEIGALCNNAELRDGQDGAGDPLEVALLDAAVSEGVVRETLLKQMPERREVAFDPELKMMATVHGVTAPYRVAVKGAPEAVLTVTSLAENEQRTWLAKSEELAAEGLRVLALAERTTDRADGEVFFELDFVGLVGMRDPPRAGVDATVAACRRAGVRIVMATGDHPATALHIARASGLVDEKLPEVVLGEELTAATARHGPQRERLLAARVIARVSPKQKLELVALHQSAGAIVAMTGDGVNDAPALRKADIGVAMGGRGTAAAREAADMVLKDDDLSTIVVAIAEGRAIWDNIRNFVMYLLSCNISEVLVVALAAAVSAPLPLLPLQILFLNLVTDVFPALALGVGEGAPGILEQPPRDSREPLVGPRDWWAMTGYGLLLTASVLSAFGAAIHLLGLPPEGAVTVSFLTLAFAQLWHVFNMRRPRSGLFANEVTKNPWIWGAVGLCIAILLAAVYLRPIAEVLSLAPPGRTGWVLIALASLGPLVVGQLVKELARLREHYATLGAAPRRRLAAP